MNSKVNNHNDKIDKLLDWVGSGNRGPAPEGWTTAEQTVVRMLPFSGSKENFRAFMARLLRNGRIRRGRFAASNGTILVLGRFEIKPPDLGMLVVPVEIQKTGEFLQARRAAIEVYEENNDGSCTVVFADSENGMGPIGEPFLELVEYFRKEIQQNMELQKDAILDELTHLQQEIINILQEATSSSEPITDEILALKLHKRGCFNKTTGEPYTREHINRQKNKLIDNGSIKL